MATSAAAFDDSDSVPRLLLPGLNFPVRATMDHDVQLVSDSLDIREAVLLLAESSSPCLVAVDQQQRPLGLVTDSDLIPAAVRLIDPNSHLTRRQVLRAGPNFLDFLQDRKRSRILKVADVMRHPVVSADVTMTIGQVAALMVIYEQACIPVTEAGVVVGLVNGRSVLEALNAAARSQWRA